MPVGLDGHLRQGEPVVLAAGHGTLEARPIDQRVVDDADHPRPGIPVRIAERVELLGEHIGEPGLRGEDPRRGRVERLVDADEPARERPAAQLRLLRPPDQQGPEGARRRQ